MKRTIGLVLLSSALAAGCGLLPEEGADSGGDDAAATADPTTYTQAPGSTLTLKDPKVGYRIATRTTGTGFENKSSVAVVGEGPGVWHVELESSSYAGYVMGLVVDKQSGDISKAVLGKPGESGEPIDVPDATPGDSSVPAGVDEEVTIGIGSFASKKVVQGDTTSWTGTEGDLAGVLLRVDNPAMGPYELEKMPASVKVEVGGTSVDVVKLAYSNGSQYWDTDHAVIKALQPHGFAGKGRVKTIYTKPVNQTTEVTAVQTDHAAQLQWN